MNPHEKLQADSDDQDDPEHYREGDAEAPQVQGNWPEVCEGRPVGIDQLQDDDGDGHRDHRLGQRPIAAGVQPGRQGNQDHQADAGRQQRRLARDNG